MRHQILWGIKSLFIAPFFKKFKLPSYIGGFLFFKGLNNVEIHKRVRIFPGLRIETHNGGGIVFEDGVAIGQNFHITSINENLVIGKNTTISGNTFVTNIDHEYQGIDKHIMDQPMIFKKTRIGENCFIGYGVAIQAGTILGKQCIVGANSVVRGIFEDYCVIVGAPAKVVKRYNPLSDKWEKTDSKGNFI